MGQSSWSQRDVTEAKVAKLSIISPWIDQFCSKKMRSVIK